MISIVLYFILQTAGGEGARNTSMSLTSLFEDCLANFHGDWERKWTCTIHPPPTPTTRPTSEKQKIEEMEIRKKIHFLKHDLTEINNVECLQITTHKIVFNIYLVVTGVKRSATENNLPHSLFKMVNVLQAILWTRQLLERLDRGFIISAIRQTTTLGILGFPDLIWLSLTTLGNCQLPGLRVVVWPQLLLVTWTAISKISNSKSLTPRRKFSLLFCSVTCLWLE